LLRLFSFDGRVNIEGLLLILVRLLVPVLPVPTFGLLPRVTVSVAVPTDFLAPIELPVREVLLRSIRLLGVLVNGFIALEVDDLLALIELPMREVLPWLTRLLELLVDEPLALTELPMREILLRLIWLRAFVVDDFPALEREDAKFLALKELPTREALL